MKSFAVKKQLPIYYFLTGGAGVGKSVVIETLYQGLVRLFGSKEGDNPDEVRVMLTAYTGKAAKNIGGIHLHKQFNFPIACAANAIHIDFDKLGDLNRKFKNLEVIIIDEISLVSNNIFRVTDIYCRKFLKKMKEFFGGISVIAVGDFYQLQPFGYNASWIFNDLKKDYDAFCINDWKDKFQIHELTEIMRQKDDLPFANLLKRLRVGEHTKEDIELLKTRLITRSDENYWLYEPHICATTVSYTHLTLPTKA